MSIPVDVNCQVVTAAPDLVQGQKSSPSLDAVTGMKEYVDMAQALAFQIPAARRFLGSRPCLFRVRSNTFLLTCK